MPPWMPMAIGVVALVGWVFRQLHLQKTDNALIDLRVFSSAGFTRAVILMAVICLIMFGSLVLLPFYIQNGLDLSPLQSALIILPGGILMGFAGPFVGAWYDRIGPRPLVVPGAMITTVALALMAMLFADTTPWWLVGLLYFILCAGLALQFGPLFTASLGSLTPKFYSYGSATLGTIQQLAGAAGTSLFIVIFTMTTVSTLTGVSGTPTPTDMAHGYVAGTKAALTVGAIASLLPVILAFFVKRPASEGQGAPAPMH
jgi:DHA2 family lincomycin resistance protein-like MFS transporter